MYYHSRFVQQDDDTSKGVAHGFLLTISRERILDLLKHNTHSTGTNCKHSPKNIKSSTKNRHRNFCYWRPRGCSLARQEGCVLACNST